MKIARTAIAAMMLLLGACSGDDSKNNNTDGAIGDASATGGTTGTNTGGGACSSISCYVASENLCDDYTQATATQCNDAPSACSTRSGVLAKPAACPTAGFKAKCTMPGPGGYVLRFYGTRGDGNDMSFCTGMAMGTWSTTF